MSRSIKLLAFVAIFTLSNVSFAAPVALTPSSTIDVITNGFGESLGNSVLSDGEGIFDFNVISPSNVRIELFNATGFSNLHLFNDAGVMLERDVAVSNDKTMDGLMLSTGIYYATVSVWGHEPDTTIGSGKAITDWVGEGFTNNGTQNIDYDLRISVDPKAVVPLPAAVWLLISGLVGMGMLGRRA